MKNVLLPVCFLMLFVFGANFSVFAQDEESSATLEETMNWIGGKFTTEDFVYFIRDPETHLFFINNANENSNIIHRINGCNLFIEQEGKDLGEDFKNSLRISFADIDPLTVRKSPYDHLAAILMDTVASKKFVFVHNGVTKQISSVEIMFSRVSPVTKEKTENRNRAIKAIKHAVKLCGGKADPF